MSIMMLPCIHAGQSDGLKGPDMLRKPRLQRMIRPEVNGRRHDLLSQRLPVVQHGSCIRQP